MPAQRGQHGLHARGVERVADDVEDATAGEHPRRLLDRLETDERVVLEVEVGERGVTGERREVDELVVVDPHVLERAQAGERRDADELVVVRVSVRHVDTRFFGEWTRKSALAA